MTTRVTELLFKLPTTASTLSFASDMKRRLTTFFAIAMLTLRIVVAGVSFPLTPALSLGARVTRNPVLGTKRSYGFSEDWRTILPLPWERAGVRGTEAFEFPKVA